MLFKTKAKAFSCLLVFLALILLNYGCGKMGDPVPPKHLKAPLSDNLLKRGFEKHDDSNNICGADDSTLDDLETCKKER